LPLRASRLQEMLTGTPDLDPQTANWAMNANAVTVQGLGRVLLGSPPFAEAAVDQRVGRLSIA
jgi:hypothetical protein